MELISWKQDRKEGAWGRSKGPQGPHTLPEAERAGSRARGGQGPRAPGAHLVGRLQDGHLVLRVDPGFQLLPRAPRVLKEDPASGRGQDGQRTETVEPRQALPARLASHSFHFHKGTPKLGARQAGSNTGRAQGRAGHPGGSQGLAATRHAGGHVARPRLLCPHPDGLWLGTPKPAGGSPPTPAAVAGGADSLHLLGQVLGVLTDGVGQLGHGVQHQVVENHLQRAQASAQPPKPCFPAPAPQGRGACLLAVPRPRLVGQGVLAAVVHVLVQVSGAQGAGRHLLEVEAGLGDALNQLWGQGQRPRGGGVRQVDRADPSPVCSESPGAPTPAVAGPGPPALRGAVGEGGCTGGAPVQAPRTCPRVGGCGAAGTQAHLLAGGDGGGRGAGDVVEGGAAGRPRRAQRVPIPGHVVDLTGQDGHVLHQCLAQPAASEKEGRSRGVLLAGPRAGRLGAAAAGTQRCPPQAAAPPPGVGRVPPRRQPPGGAGPGVGSLQPCPLAMAEGTGPPGASRPRASEGGAGPPRTETPTGSHHPYSSSGHQGGHQGCHRAGRGGHRVTDKVRVGQTLGGGGPVTGQGGGEAGLDPPVPLPQHG